MWQKYSLILYQCSCFLHDYFIIIGAIVVFRLIQIRRDEKMAKIYGTRIGTRGEAIKRYTSLGRDMAWTPRAKTLTTAYLPFLTRPFCFSIRVHHHPHSAHVHPVFLVLLRQKPSRAKSLITNAECDPCICTWSE